MNARPAYLNTLRELIDAAREGRLAPNDFRQNLEGVEAALSFLEPHEGVAPEGLGEPELGLQQEMVMGARLFRAGLHLLRDWSQGAQTHGAEALERGWEQILSAHDLMEQVRQRLEEAHGRDRQFLEAARTRTCIRCGCANGSDRFKCLRCGMTLPGGQGGLGEVDLV